MASSSAANLTTSPLRPLSLEPLVPWQDSNPARALTAFKDIDAVRVVRNPDLSSSCKYMVEVYSDQLSRRAPTANDHGPGGVQSASSSAVILSSRLPSSTIAKSLDDFAALRSQLYNLALYSHKNGYCAFCRSTIEYVKWGNPQPSAVARLFGDEEKVLQSSSKLVDDLVSMVAARLSTPPGSSTCRAEVAIPKALCEFLFGSSHSRA